MSQYEGISAVAVWDGGEVTIPAAMGTPRTDQMQGTAAELLSELAGRVCYDSLGKGRASFDTPCRECGGTGLDHPCSSKSRNTDDDTCPACKGTKIKQGYHSHIREVGHGSVWEHYNFTIEVVFTPPGSYWPESMLRTIALLANRPGVYFWRPRATTSLRITLNLRAIAEWDNWTGQWRGFQEEGLVSSCMAMFGHRKAARIIPSNTSVRLDEGVFTTWDGPIKQVGIVEPIDDMERWVSLYVTGSRGLSHELVRHGDYTAISQRSTRYVDESESPWVTHPLIEEYAESLDPKVNLNVTESYVANSARTLYQSCVIQLEPWLIARGVDKATARKQARGAARGYLGNALSTELVFSANMTQWRRILTQRGSVHADAEIRALAVEVYQALRTTRYADSLDGWALAPSPDGIGQIVTPPPRPLGLPQQATGVV